MAAKNTRRNQRLQCITRRPCWSVNQRLTAPKRFSRSCPPSELARIISFIMTARVLPMDGLTIPFQKRVSFMEPATQAGKIRCCSNLPRSFRTCAWESGTSEKGGLMYLSKNLEYLSKWGQNTWVWEKEYPGVAVRNIWIRVLNTCWVGLSVFQSIHANYTS